MVENTDTTAGLLDIQELAESLNGYDQIAIRLFFHERIDTLGEDGIMMMRAMLFVSLRRGDSALKDKESFERAMSLPLSELTELFDQGDGSVDPEDESATAELDRQFAEFVVGTGLSYTPDQFRALTLVQRSAVIQAANKRG